jgi:hypothetical protein
VSDALAKLATASAQLMPRGWGSMRWAELVVTDRRWAAPLAAMALGFGLFVGVALGPGSEGSSATPATLVQVPATADEEGGTGDGGAGGGAQQGGGGGSIPGGDGGPSAPPLDGTPIVPAPPVVPVTPTAPPPAEEPEETAPPPADDPVEDPAEDEEDGQELAGTVAHVNAAASSYALVAPGELLYAVHAKRLPDPGTKLTVPVRELANGTYAEDGKPDADGNAGSVRFAGVVTFVDTDPTAPAYSVSRLGASVLVHVRPTADGTLPKLPELGAFASVSAELEPPPTAEPPPEPPPPAPPVAGCQATPDDPRLEAPRPEKYLWETKAEVDSEPFDYADLAGILTAICPDSGQLAISADDIRASEADLVLAVPDEIDLGGFEVGDSVAATANIAEDGSLELAGLAGDERIDGADDPDLLRGDLAGG